jgi:ubiquinone biosynthesis accessory factor UbiK
MVIFNKNFQLHKYETMLKCTKYGDFFMIDASIFNDLSNKIKELIESSPTSDLNKNIHALIQGMFTKMELVSREEYDVQTEILRQTREKLDMLEQKLEQLTQNNPS